MALSGYLTGEALAGAPCDLRRARRETDSARCLLKAPRPGGLTPALAAAARREFDLLSSIDCEGVPRAFAFDDGTATVVIEDIGGDLLSTRLLSGPLSLESFLPTALSLARTVGHLHRHGIVCRNLYPSAIFVEGKAGRAQIFDFSGASRLRHDAAADMTSTADRERLAYVSPEQTGRMNRLVDHRSDLYSLGAIYYAMLTGRPPFDSEDALEVVHGHIARTPVSPADYVAGLPGVISDLVMRLLAKTAERRYQTASGLVADLERCGEAWRTTGGVLPFTLGHKDVSDRFTMPQYLYGRERETKALLDAFDRASRGAATLMLVAGYSGVGKTSLVNEVHKPIVRQRGRFVAGKFDQLDRNTPYGAIVQAFRSLVRQVLAESDDRVALVRSELHRALGANAAVMAAVIPELEWLVGSTPDPPPLGPSESLNRFAYAIQDFISVFSSVRQPLVVFLDDLQWADPATLALLPRVIGGGSLRGLLVIGAYRDNEVTPGHPLPRAIADIREAGAVVEEIHVPPLQLPDIEALIGDALGGEGAAVAALARLVHLKTDGNPFFVTQLLRTLHEDGLLEFDEDRRSWKFDLGRIEKASITDNVVELMTRRLRQLAPPTQQAVALAACIGGSFPLRTLATVLEQSPSAAAARLWGAIEEGLILPAGPGYEQIAHASDEALDSASPWFSFLHDRVQQAAYALSPPDQKKAVHLRVGRLLLAECGNRVPDDALFEVVDHLNFGLDLIEDSALRERLAGLNLRAGRRAKASAAFSAALGYFEHGRRLLPDDRWASDYDRTFALTTELAECRYLCGHLEGAEAAFEELLRETRSPLEKASAYRMRMAQLEDKASYRDAARVGRQALALFGLELPETPEAISVALDEEFSAIDAALGARPISALVDLPVADHAETRMVITLLTALWAPAYILGESALASLLSARIVRLSMSHGNAEDSAYGFVTHAITVGPVRGDYATAYEWGALALAVNDRLSDRRGRAKVYQQFHVHVNLWRRPIQSSIPHAREACRSGLESGDFTYAGYGAFTETWAALLANRDLDRFVADYTPTVALLRRIRMPSLADGQEVLLSWARALQGRTASPRSLSHPQFDEAVYLSTYAANPFCLTFYYAAKLQLDVLFDAYDAARDAARTARRDAWTPPGTIWPVLIDFWGGLAAASLADAAEGARRDELRREVGEAARSLAALAAHGPENFRTFALTLEAECARLDGDTSTSLALFDAAIDYARETANVQAEAFACERGARAWLEAGRETVAAAYLTSAIRAYRTWGATAKVTHLETTFAAILQRAGPEADSAGRHALDVASVLKAARAIVSEVEIDKLMKQLVRLAIESGGGERGLLILLDAGDRLTVVAEGLAGGEVILTRTPIDERDDLAHRIVRLSFRTGERVLADDAASEARWSSDPYVALRQPSSIACVPIVHQGRRAGLFYLENNLVAGAFGPDRLELLQILSAEAAIALENAKLYEGMRQEVERRSSAEDALRQAVAELNVLKDRLHAENVYLQEEIRAEHRFDEIVGTSPALLDALRRVERVAPTESSVLVLGETGSGKELFARAIHSRSDRRDRPLVKVNCGALPTGLVESELFGHVRGAFTGALQNRTGRFELAHGGTIFLDEVGELTPDTQVKLLRVLQEREFEPVGSSRTLRVDVRIIAATNRDIDASVKAGRFRADLLYRLNVFPIVVPPLRDRAGDIPLIVAFLVSGLAKRLGRPLQGFSRRDMDRLVTYRWPGNVRELQNVVERAAIVSPGPVLELDAASLGPPGSAGAEEDAGTGNGTMDAVERRHIVEVLRRTSGVVEGPKGAAGILGLHPNTLRSRMKKLGISRAHHDIS